MKIGVIGNGVVGSATAKVWTGHCDEVRIYDSNPLRIRHSLDHVLKCDFVFVCLPTPQYTGEGLGREHLTKGINPDALVCFFEGLEDHQRLANFIIKSTVPIGFTRATMEKMKCPNVVHSPEFLTERTAVEDATNPRLNVIGVPGGQKTWPTHPVGYLYLNRFSTPYVYVSSDESETMKLVMNSWFATKVAFWNEVRTMTDKMGLDYEEIRNAIVDEGRVHELHTDVPGPDGKFGFGGACLPKDLSELIRTMDALNLQPGVMRAAYDRNELLDRPRTA